MDSLDIRKTDAEGASSRLNLAALYFACYLVGNCIAVNQLGDPEFITVEALYGLVLLFDLIPLIAGVLLVKRFQLAIRPSTLAYGLFLVIILGSSFLQTWILFAKFVLITIWGLFIVCLVLEWLMPADKPKDS